MQEYGIITILPFSKYSSPLFAQRKTNGKLRFLVDLRRVNHLIRNDYEEHNHPGTILSDAAQHLAGKKHFCKLDCCQVYPCFSGTSRIFAFLRLAQGLNRSFSAFISLVRKYLDPLLRANCCAQYADDIGIADELIENLKLVSQQLSKAGLYSQHEQM